MHTCWYWWWCRRRRRRRLFSGVMFPFSFLSRFTIERKWMIEPEHFASQPTDIFNIPVWSINIDTHAHTHTHVMSFTRCLFSMPFSFSHIHWFLSCAIFFMCGKYIYFSFLSVFVFKHGTGRKIHTQWQRRKLKHVPANVCVCIDCVHPAANLRINLST